MFHCKSMQRRPGRALASLVLVVAALAGAAAIVVNNGERPRDVVQQPAIQPPTARQKVEARLDQLDQESQLVTDRHLDRIRAFIRDRRAGAKPFAEWAYSWTAKWVMVKGKVSGDDGAGLRQFLQEKFAENIFKTQDLQAVLDAAVAGFLTENQGLENQALVQIRADLAQEELFRAGPIDVQTDGGFQEEYKRLAEQVLPKVADDLKVGVAGQLTTFVGSELVAQTLGRSLAARLGLSSGVMGNLARSGLVGVAVGVVAWIGIEFIVDWLLSHVAGYNPTEQLTGQVGQALGKIEQQLIDGDPAAVANYRRLRQQQADDPAPENQLQCGQEADRLEQSGALGLRFQLERIRELQSRMRREALRKLLAEQGQ